jgi:hypothetical protein
MLNKMTLGENDQAKTDGGSSGEGI